MKRAYTHVHCIEDIWIDMRTKFDIIKIDYYNLTMQQIIDINMLKIPSDFQIEDDVTSLIQNFIKPFLIRISLFLSNRNKRKVPLSWIGFNPSW